MHWGLGQTRATDRVLTVLTQGVSPPYQPSYLIMYTVKQLLDMTWVLLGQAGATYAVGANNFIHLVNHAVNMVYNYEGMHWSWQHRKDLFNMSGKTQGALFSRWPVRKVDKFRAGQRKDVDKVGIEKCFCNMNLPDEVIPACGECQCEISCTPLNLKQILPQNQLCAGQYQISGGAIAGMGGFDQRIIKVNYTGITANVLWVSYFCGPVKVEKFSDVVPVPDSFIHILVWIIASTVLPTYGIARQQEDLTWYSLYRKELDYLRKHDTIVPEEVEIADVGYDLSINQQRSSSEFTSLMPSVW